jgi:hypothetical protein
MIDDTLSLGDQGVIRENAEIVPKVDIHAETPDW